MRTRRDFLCQTFLTGLPAARVFGAKPVPRIDPLGKVHIPIGIANTLDTLKTFIEAEGSFSPGFGSYGIYAWVFDRDKRLILSPTDDGAKCERGLRGRGYLIPWIHWQHEDVEMYSEICEVRRPSPAGDVFVVAWRYWFKNRSRHFREYYLYVGLRPLGPAGWDVSRISVDGDGSSLLVDGHPAIMASERPKTVGVAPEDTAGIEAVSGRTLTGKEAESMTGDCSGLLRYEVQLESGRRADFRFLCPVLPGRRAARHHWTDLGQNALVDIAPLNSSSGDGLLQPDPGSAYYKGLDADALFEEAKRYWNGLLSGAAVSVPDSRWADSMAAMLGHAAISMNNGAPDVAAVNYNVFNRDAVYVANMLQKSGLFDLAGKVIDYVLAHPFNGRARPEADNPGQVLWILGQHWLFTRDAKWLGRAYPSVRKLAAMIAYYRTTPGPHWVNADSLEFGDALQVEKRQELKPGSCDGFHPEYTEAFDIAGLEAAAALARAAEELPDAAEWERLHERLLREYDEKFGAALDKEYGSYSVLWPCRLYPLASGKAHDQFKGVGQKKPESWHYFPLATAHQGLLAGNREAGYATLEAYLALEQMQGWYALDEGGGSSSGGWQKVRTTWPRSLTAPGDNPSVAMPHGWAIAEFWLLMRDCFVFEDGEKLVLLAGVDPYWFRQPLGMKVYHINSYFGPCSLRWRRNGEGAALTISETAKPPDGFTVRFPEGLKAKAMYQGRELRVAANGDCAVPTEAREIQVLFAS